MKKYVAKHIEEMPSSGIRRFFDLANTKKGVVSLGVGEPDFVTPWHIREAAILSLEKGKTAYTSNQGLMELREEIAKYLFQQFQVQYHPQKEMVITVGASEGIDIALRTVLNFGDEVLVPEPSYVSYKPCISMCYGVPVVIPLKAENQFRLQPEEIEERITAKTKAILLSYPSNPTGAIMEREDLEKISRVILEHDLIVISDEIYAELTYGQKHVSIASLPGMKERTILLNGFSKAFAMTGWRLGYAVGPEEMIRNMNKIHQYIIMCAPTMSQYAGLEALQSEMIWDEIEEMRQAYDERRKVMLQGFKNMGLSCFEPLGAFYLFPSIKETGFTSEEFCEKLLAEKSVAVVPGDSFGESGEGFIRCSYAYSIENILFAMEKISEFVRPILRP